jgi:dTDP-4-dehydrorhamnose 3,5-epimerase
MPFTAASLPGVIIFEPTVYPDGRGFFFESYNRHLFQLNNIGNDFVQDNQSFSLYVVIRGLHYPRNPYEQAKLVRVIQCKILDVVVDLRVGSRICKSISIELSVENRKQMFIQKGLPMDFQY